MKSLPVSLLLALGISLLNLAASAQDFVPIKGAYYGIFFEPDGAWSDSSGSITISTTSRGTYSASLQRGWGFFRFSGRLCRLLPGEGITTIRNGEGAADSHQ